MRRAFAGVGVRGGAIESTARAGDEAELTRRAIDEGATTIVAVGGDGTWSNVASAILRRGADCRLGLVAAGSGNDFAKSAGVPANDLVASARLAVDGPDVRVDVGRIEGEWFLNALGFGFDVAVLEDSNRAALSSGTMHYAYAALRQLLRYRGLGVACDDDPGGSLPRRLLVVIANGRRFGGAFRIAPAASLHDGLLDLVAIPDASSLERVRLFLSAARGRHVELASVEVRQSGCFALRFDHPPAYDLDGELRRAGSSALVVECVPAALRVVGATPQRSSLLREPG